TAGSCWSGSASRGKSSMAAPPHDLAAALFEGLAGRLRQDDEFRLGVDHYLRMQALLDRLDGAWEPEQMKTLLAPSVATREKQQEQFYDAFDAFLEESQRPFDAVAGIELQVTPAALDGGEQPVAMRSRAALSLSNPGTRPLGITGAAIEGPDASAF